MDNFFPAAWQSLYKILASDPSARAELEKALRPLLSNPNATPAFVEGIRACIEPEGSPDPKPTVRIISRPESGTPSAQPAQDEETAAANPSVQNLAVTAPAQPAQDAETATAKPSVQNAAATASVQAVQSAESAAAKPSDQNLAVTAPAQPAQSEEPAAVKPSAQNLTATASILSAQSRQPAPDKKAVCASGPFRKNSLNIALQQNVSKLAYDLQKYISWGETQQAEDLEERLLSLKGFPVDYLNRIIQEAKRRGREFKDDKAAFQKLVCREGVLGASVFKQVQVAIHENPLLLRAYRHALNFYAGKQLDQLLAKDRDKAKTFIAQCSNCYGFLREALEARYKEWVPPMEQIVVPNVEHRIHLLPANPEWTLYIDETGVAFEDTGGKEGRMVGLLLPQCTGIRQLPPDAHATNESLGKKQRLLQELLSAECGIFGIAAGDMPGKRTQEVWYAMVERLILWVLRLVPLARQETQQIKINIQIENRSDFTADLDTLLLERHLEAELDKEAGNRNRRVKIGTIAFAKKGTGHIGWVDVVANLWGSKELSQYLAKSKLEGTCLFRNAGTLLFACEKALRGQAIEGVEWQALIERRDAEEKGSLAFLALEALKQHCNANPAEWQRYVGVVEGYLNSKVYDLAVLERQANWLHAMDNADGLSMELRFFYHMVELAHLNHKGVVHSRELTRVQSSIEELAPKVGALVPHAHIHAALRLAVVDCNAFDFIEAEKRLDPWNPAVGGRLLGGLWDGKLYSSLGQAKAFQGCPEQALELFAKAIALFETLEARPGEGERQKKQTATYAAIAAMDVSDATRDDVLPYLKIALGGRTPMEAVYALRGTQDRYSQYVLARYLSTMGTENERVAYLENEEKWLTEEGCGRGHPWPLIQYLRWTLVKDGNLRRRLADTVQACTSAGSGATVDLICLTLELAMGTAKLSNARTRQRLDALEKELPAAASQIRLLRHVKKDGRAGLVERVLTFNYR